MPPADPLEVKVLYEPSSSGADPADLVDIVAVPGLGIHEDQIWTSNGVSWLSDEKMLPFWVPCSRIMCFSYETAWLGEDTVETRLPHIAHQLLRGIMAFRKSHRMRPLVFIGHCFGGLVIEKAILLAKFYEEEYPLLAMCLAGVIFLGTPQRGSKNESKAAIIAAIASTVGFVELPSLIQALERESDYLTDLMEEFTRIANIHSIPIFCFFEKLSWDSTNATRLIGRSSISHHAGSYPRNRDPSPLPDKRDFVVDGQSGTIEGFPNLCLSTDHFGLTKYAEPDDENYILVRNQVVKFVEDAKSCVTRRMRTPSRENEKCLNALFMGDPADDMEMIEHNNGKVLEGSSFWLQQDPNFNDWLQCKKTKVLWVSGDPGKGKTMLAISMVKSILRRIKPDSLAPDVLVAYFFCDNKDNRRISSIAVLRSLLYQILNQRPDLCSQFRTLYEREGDQLFTSPVALQSIWRTLNNVFASPSVQRVYIVIDALDELEEESTQDLLKLLKPLLDGDPDAHDQQPGLKQGVYCEVKWLLTSRNVDYISRSLRNTLNISLEANSDHVKAIIWRFIDRRVDELQAVKRYDTALATFVKNTLQEKSEGTFLYVSMVCRELSQPGVRLINTKSVLNRLPRGLTPLYQRILDQIIGIEDEDLVHRAKALLRSMVLALRPLTVHELAVAADLPEECRNDPSMLYEYIALCGSFINRRDDTVHFVHETVKTYLLSITEVFTSPIPEYHAQITESFINHINERNLNKADEQEDPNLLEYPSSFWLYHGRQSGSSMKWKPNLSSGLFSRDSHIRQKWLECYWVKNHNEWDKRPATFTALQLAAYAGIGNLVVALLARGDAIDVADSNGHTALIWTAKNGYDDVVRSLLDSGANHQATTTDGLTAVCWATINGHLEVVQTLIEYGAKTQVANAMGRTPLHHAAAHGHAKVLISLLEAGADINAKDIAQHSPVQRATVCGDLNIAKILVEKKADLSVRDKDGLALVHMAAAWDGHLELVEFWLNHTSDLETKDDQGWTPLMHSAWFGHPAIAAYLIKQGADLEARSFNGNTSLHLATWNGHANVVRVLLDGKADPNTACNKNETPLQQAAWRGYTTVCQLLLEAGADPNAMSDTGLTPLHQAAANGHEVVAKVLLEWGADPNAIDSTKQTPGARAEENNHLTLAKLLKNLEIRDDNEDVDEGLAQPGITSEFEGVDPAVCELLKVPPESCIGQSHGTIGFSKPTKITALVNGVATHYFMKSGSSGEMFATEHAALRALHAVVPSICPFSLGHGKFANSDDHFLLMEFIDTSYRSDNSNSGNGVSLAQKLAQLHTTLAPIPLGYQQPMFGWPTATYCGSTRQANALCASWAKFFTENRLLAVLQLIDESHGTDEELRAGVETVVQKVVPRLLRNGHLGGRRGIMPVLVHGDLWMGNRVCGKIASCSGAEELTFDPSVCYAHSEFELGIMRMFGGFSAGFFHEYHRLVPRTEPKREYEDRIRLYQLYHYLNHYLIFRGGYKDDAMDIIKTLIDKYVDSDELEFSS